MRIVIIEFMSLDGVVQAPGGPDEDTDGGFAHGGWSHPFFDEVVGGAFDGALTGAEALLFGRRTWQTMAAAWPGRAGDPFADQMNAIRKYVVSATLADDELTWNNTTRIPGDEAVARIWELRETDGGRPSWSWGAPRSCAPSCARVWSTSSGS
jgi:dihydrofolate reductase